MLTDFTNKFKEKLSGMFNKNEQKPLTLNQQETQTNQQFLKESLLKMKENKNKTFKQKIFDDPQGKIEEIVFYFPRNSEVNYFLDEYAIDYDLTQDLDNNLPLMYSDKDKTEHDE